MKIKSTITFRLISPEGDAIFTAKKMPMNLRYELSAKLTGETDREKQEGLRDYVTKVLQHVTSVEGVELEDGTPLALEDIHTLNIEQAFANRIVQAYFEAMEGVAATPEKKDSSPDVVSD